MGPSHVFFWVKILNRNPEVLASVEPNPSRKRPPRPPSPRASARTLASATGVAEGVRPSSAVLKRSVHAHQCPWISICFFVSIHLVYPDLEILDSSLPSNATSAAFGAERVFGLRLKSRSESQVLIPQTPLQISIPRHPAYGAFLIAP